jgi:hypothetical protein
MKKSNEGSSLGQSQNLRRGQTRAEPPAQGAEQINHVPESQAVWSAATKIEATSSWQPTALEKNLAKCASDHTRGCVMSL